MYNPDDKILTVSPWIPNPVPSNAVFVSQEGRFTPMADGRWPVYPFAYDRWYKEELSWYDTSYIHAGLNPFLFCEIEGKDFLNFLEAVSVNTFRNFPVGKARHTIWCGENGKILIDGIVVRRGEEEFLTMCLVDPAGLNHMMGDKFQFTSKVADCDRFFYQLCGPRSLEIVEHACKQDLHDIKFMHIKEGLNIAGHDVFVLRTGMAGTLGYEVHGTIDGAVDVYNELMRVGQEYGIQPLGRLGYVNAHCEGSIAQAAEHFLPCIPGGLGTTVISGSIPRDSELIYRSPIDLGWDNLVKFDHEFVGKEALQKELAGPHRTMVHLIWDRESVLDCIRASMDPELRVDPMDPACDYDYVRNNEGIHIDAVYDGEKFIGASSGRMLSAKTREMVSMCTIDTEYAVEGRMVEVLWGNPDTTQVRINAKVALTPYNKVDRNEDFDVERIPHPVFD